MKAATQRVGLRRVDKWSVSTDRDVKLFGVEAELATGEAAASEVLARAGLPTHAGPFALLANGSWRELPSRWQSLSGTDRLALVRDLGGVRAVSGLELAGPGPSIEHDAAMVVWQAYQLRRSLGAADLGAIAEHAMRFAEARTMLGIELAQWHCAVVERHRQTERFAPYAGARKPDPQRTRMWADWLARDTELSANSNLSASGRAEIIKKVTGCDLTADWIARKIRELRENAAKPK